MKKIYLLMTCLLLMIAACTSDTKQESAGESAEEATQNALATSISRQVQSSPQPSATSLVLGGSDEARPTLPTIDPALVFPSQTPTLLPEQMERTDVPVFDDPFTQEVAIDPPEIATEIAENVQLAGQATDLRGDHYWLARPFFAAGEIKDYTEATYRFGDTGGGRYQVHHGADIGNPEGTVILAMAGGKVFFAGDDFLQQEFGPLANFYGNTIVIEHTVTLPDSGLPFTFYSLYGHLSQIFVKVGDTVQQHQEIGLVGSTGVAIGPHLHVEVRIKNPYDYTDVYNPDLWLQPWIGFGVLSGRVSTVTGELLPGVEVQVISVERGRTYRAFTYTEEGVSSDPFYQENFVLPDLPVGNYEVRVGYQGRVAYRRQITIEPQKTTFINAQVE